MGRCVILGGGPIGDYDRARSALRPDDWVVCCDSGLYHAPRLGVRPALVVGDFDSCHRPQTEAEIITLPSVKDDTDTVYAAREALRRGWREFLLLGVTGGRIDHTLANLGLLMALDRAGAHGVIADAYGEMEILSRGTAYVEDRWRWFSLLPVGGPASGVTVTGAKYPLQDARIEPEYPYGVSNEPLPGGRAAISLGEGRLLLVRTDRDWID